MSFFDDLFGGGGNNTSTSTSGPSPYGQQYLTPGLDTALQNFKTGKYNQPYYPGSTVADFSPEQLQAQAMGTARATNGSPVVGQAQDYIGSILNGDYLKAGNPNTQNLIDQTTAQVNSQLSRAGRLGSNTATARGLTEGIAPILYQDYANQLNRMDNAAQFAPTLANVDWQDINALNSIGGARQTQAQNLVNADVNRFNWNAAQPATSLETYLRQIGGNLGTTSTTTAPNNGPTAAQQGVGAGIGLLGTLASLWGQ